MENQRNIKSDYSQYADLSEDATIAYMNDLAEQTMANADDMSLIDEIRERIRKREIVIQFLLGRLQNSRTKVRPDYVPLQVVGDVPPQEKTKVLIRPSDVVNIIRLIFKGNKQCFLIREIHALTSEFGESAIRGSIERLFREGLLGRIRVGKKAFKYGWKEWLDGEKTEYEIYIGNKGK